MGRNRKIAPVNKKFNRLTILEEVKSMVKTYNNQKTVQRFVKCRCDCGNIITTRLLMVVNNKIKSCGCLRSEAIKQRLFTHGLSRHPLYKIWTSIKQRCLNNKTPYYKDYGGRGISVCKKWSDSFSDFYNWAINNGWVKGMEIDRKNNNGKYTPSNCRITTRRNNLDNKRNTIYVVLNGESISLRTACDRLKLNNNLVRGMMHRNGWNFEKAINYYIS